MARPPRHLAKGRKGPPTKPRRGFNDAGPKRPAGPPPPVATPMSPPPMPGMGAPMPPGMIPGMSVPQG